MTLRHITDAQMLRAIDDLGRNLAAAVPGLPAPRPGQAGPADTRWDRVDRGISRPTGDRTGEAAPAPG